VWFTLCVSHTKIKIFREEATSTLNGFHVQCRFSILVKLEFEDDGFLLREENWRKTFAARQEPTTNTVHIICHQASIKLHTPQV